MHILLTDETNVQPSENVKFFIYGGLMFPIDHIALIDSRIEDIRKKAGYKPSDELKFDTRARPEYVSVEQATEAKRQVVELCIELGCKFIAHIILHDIIRNQDLDRQVMWAADYVIGRYNKYLTEINDIGICIVDNLPSKIQFRYLSDKFSKGLKLPDGKSVRLDRIKLFAATCINASHANSAMDIVLGSFRYCINNPKNPQAAGEMMRNVARLMWYEKIGNKINFRNRGLIIRPELEKIEHALYRTGYDLMLKLVTKLINENDVEV